MAGISAARTILAENKRNRTRPVSFAVLEADDKIGGRVQSELIHLPNEKSVIINPGAQWFHKDLRKGAPENPLLELARKWDPLVEDPMNRIFYHEGAVDTNDNSALIKKARALIDAHEGEDMSLADFFNQQKLGTPTALRTTFAEVETGAPLEQVSLIDVRNNVACNMGHFTKHGMHRFVQHFAKEIKPHVELNKAITHIKWDPEGKKETEIETKDGALYKAKQCILTVSVGVLKSGQIKFEPPMPKSHQEQLSHIYMGNFNKAFLVFDKGFQMPVGQNTHMDMRTKDVQKIWPYAGDERTILPQDMFCLSNDNAGNGHLDTAFFGGDLAKLCDESPHDATQLAIRALEEVRGSAVRKHLIHTHVTQWGANSRVLGGYSRVEIGYHDARQKLAEPFGNVSLAGEAYGTIHPKSGRNWATHMAGAAISGERAAIYAIGQVKHHPRIYTPGDNSMSLGI